jgi:RNA polymerase subunit RPABC4/transcription elongation factor Spt4
MICPFCRQSDIPDNPGKTVCPLFKTVFEIDDRDECVFVDTGSLKMPIYGQVCAECGRVQQERRESCVYCGSGFIITFH